MNNSYECPRCRGLGLIPGLVCGACGCKASDMICAVCAGEGRVTSGKLAGFFIGEDMRLDRIRRDVSLAEEAHRLGMSPEKLSAIEHGKV